MQDQFGSSRRICCCYVSARNLWTGLVTLGCIAYYYTSSILIILYNKWLFSKFGLKFPVSVTAVHMVTSFLFAATFHRCTTGSFSIGASRAAVLRTIAIGLMVGTDIALSNISYLLVSIPFMEMVKSASPLWVLLLSLAVRIEQFSVALLASISLMSAGLCLAVYGEAKFNPAGFAMCLTASVLAAMRAVLTHTLLHASDDKKMNSIQVLYVMAPTCAIGMTPAALILEYRTFMDSDFVKNEEMGREAALAVAAGAFLAVNLNLSEFLLLGRTSAMTTSVASVAKVLIVSVSSVLLFHTQITPMNAVGYAICMCGVMGYNAIKVLGSQTQKAQYTTVEYGRASKSPATSDTALLNYAKDEMDEEEGVDDFEDLDDPEFLDVGVDARDSKALLSRNLP